MPYAAVYPFWRVTVSAQCASFVDISYPWTAVAAVQNDSTPANHLAPAFGGRDNPPYAGKYVIFCNLQEEPGDAVGGLTSHYQLGMRTAFTVD
ncbi:MAG: hypothetical protein AB7T37_05660 [Dehalococcoidia bacterium]